VAKTLRDSLPAGVEPKKSRADVSFCGVSLSFTGLDREI